jgi:class 3 adenylate cyclase/tetratricopeptide (TPR) repeat protein
MLDRMTTRPCERCGEPLPEGAKFCPNCGLPVDAVSPEERKLVTVVFADLVGSTRLSSLIDPERYRSVIASFYQAVTEELESLRGRAYNFAGDAVVGVMGIPTAHDDDALRAIRAGLLIVQRVERLGEGMALPVPLRCRVGVNTGLVAVGAEAPERGLLFGAVVNAAARLQQAAEPGTVLVGETTWIVTRDRVVFGQRIEVEAKGFEEALPAWPVVALAPRSSRRTIPFVDRRRELRLLNETYERAQEAERGHLVTLLGEPGIGKSRLVEEFVAGLPGEAKVLTSWAAPFEENATFAPLAQILLHLMGERPDASTAVIKAGLERLVDECCPPDRTHELVARLAPALGLGEESRDVGRYRVAEIRSGFLELLRWTASSGPIVMVVEDAHLAQPPLLDLLEQLVRDARGIALLVVCAARYDLLDERPDWGGGRGDSLNLDLEPMTPAEATELARQAGESLDDEAAERIARHAGGNPFFIVETTGMLMHAETEMPSDTEPLPRTLLPPTVQAVIAARIDHLPPQARDLVRKASVFARATFDRSALATIATPDDQTLGSLEEEELLLSDPDRPGVWRFRHGLVRDVAYESLSKAERRRLHLQVADKLSEHPETSARYPRTIAYHLEQAARASLDLEPSDRMIADRAVTALSDAGHLALRASQARAAADLFERALALATPERGWSTREARILAGLGEARYWLGEFEAAVSPLERSLEVCREDREVLADASRFLGDIELSIRGNRERAGELLDQALAAARELGDPWTLARTLLVAGWAPYWRDDLGMARAMFEEALTVARSNPESDPWSEARALGMLSTILSEEGEDEEKVLAIAAEALAVAEGADDRFSIAVAREHVGGTLRRLWRLDEASPQMDRSVEAFRQLGARWELASALTSRGILHRLAGRIEQAIRDLREAYRLCRELNERSIVGWTASSLIRAFIRAGDLSAAREVLAEATTVAQDGQQGSETSLLQAETELLLAEGDRRAALARAEQVLARQKELGWTKDVAAQVWWMGRVFEPDAVGGEEEMERARKFLEETHWIQAVVAPDVDV